MTLTIHCVQRQGSENVDVRYHSPIRLCAWCVMFQSVESYMIVPLCPMLRDIRKSTACFEG
jgi:hypothetical protein